MTQFDYLKEIYRNINSGKVYGNPVLDVRFPYFQMNVYADDTYIYWWNYGSSANRNTLRDLNFVIGIIFGMTPEEFCKTYQCKTIEEANAF